ncbi:hypothetical protein [Fodinicola acaciae]|uniref:hypothetical protein n=1 Tax=Fodinicola acaciae TaxID=2681555 RepID=UPI0013D66479|nr:hypothetical protein [Fodinicola acaciae]
MSNPVRVKVLRYVWDSGWSGAAAAAPWSDRTFAEIFQEHNGWSLRDFWRRGSLGRLDLRFDIDPWSVLRGAAHEELHADRRKIIAACRAQAAVDGLLFDDYDHVIVFVHEPPSDTGTYDGDLVLDQGRTLEYYQYAIGRMLGFRPGYGKGGRFDDPYCVMGSGLGDHLIDPPPLTSIGDQQWRSGPRVSAAALYRYLHDYRVTVPLSTLDEEVTLTALPDAVDGSVTLAVCPTFGGGRVAVEYRTAVGDDQGVTPGVVVHSIGVRPDGEDDPEIDPVRFEVAVPAAAGAEVIIVGDLRLKVLDAPDPSTVTVTFTRV